MPREGALSLRVMPWRKGLATAGQQTTIPEDALWQAQDFSASIDGLLHKRPGLKKWGQTIKTSSKFEPFIDESLPSWIEANDDTTILTKTVDQGKLRFNVGGGTGNETHTLSWDGTAVTDPTVRLMVQGIELREHNDVTNANTFHFRIAKNSSTGWEFALWGPDAPATSNDGAGLYYKQASDDKYVYIAGTEEIGAGAWAQLEISIDADGNTLVYVNEELVDTIVTSLLATPSLTRNNSVLELAAEVTGTASEIYSAQVVAPTWGTSSAQTVRAVTDFRASSTTGAALRGVLMCSAGGYVWHDADLLGVWRPLARQEYDEIQFFPFRRDIGWVSTNSQNRSALRLWDGRPNSAPEELDEAPPVRFATEHQTRVWAAGDRRHPLRVYYTGDREPNVWFSPDDNNISDRFDTQLKAGYLEVPSRRGDEVTAIYGDFFGSLLVFTKQGVYQIQGSGPQSYAIRSVSQEVGCAGYEAASQVGNDVWFVSSEGVHAVSATDKYGDLVSGFVSGPIQDLWGGRDTATTRVSKTFLYESRLRYSPETGLVYVAMPLDDDQTAQKIYVFNTVTQEWYGPWNIDSQAMEQVTLSTPDIEVVMHGGADGKLLYTDPSYKSDDGSTITSIIESAVINGRGLDPQLVGVEKTFKRLRIYVLPRGDWNVKVFWRADGGFYQDENSNDPNQNRSTNVYKGYGLGDEWRINIDPDGRLRSQQEMGYIEIPVDVRGYGFSFKLKQDGNAEDLVVQGFEVDFIPHGYSRD